MDDSMEIATSLSLLAMTYGRHRPHFYWENVVDTHLEQGIVHTFKGKPWMGYPIIVRSLAHSS